MQPLTRPTTERLSEANSKGTRTVGWLGQSTPHGGLFLASGNPRVLVLVTGLPSPSVYDG